MDIKYKIKLVEILRLRPADLDVIDSIGLSDECLKGLLNNNKDMLELISCGILLLTQLTRLVKE